MFHSGNDIDTQSFDWVKKVMTPEDLEVFLHSFDMCYRKDDPINPYGELGEYLTAARQAWQKHHATNRLEYFMVFDDNQPVAVSSLTNFQGVGYISNVGSLMSVRGRGFGKLVTMYCVQQSTQRGNKDHCLATEEATNPNEFYKAVGFKTRFSARLMSKKM